MSPPPPSIVQVVYEWPLGVIWSPKTINKTDGPNTTALLSSPNRKKLDRKRPLLDPPYFVV